MIRKIISIDEQKCTGCGICASACHESAIEIVNSKAKLLKEDYCDGLGDCLPICPTGAISIEEREAKEYDKNHSQDNVTLKQWPIQIKLVPTKTENFKDANLVIAADCTAYAYANFHQKFIKNKIVLIGCPKLDGGDYSNKLTDILKSNDLKSVAVVHMNLHCCTGIVDALKVALHKSGKIIPWQIVTISTDGKIVE